mmetsp:Transcript_1123/g.2207  ORF Transcript_1123/g.2207 Transcript_1123/m.2207 type:complete len:234 (-) Transcript_1123:2159-2860(-)
MVTFVENWLYVKISLTHDKVGNIEQGSDSLKWNIGLYRSVDPLHAVHLEIEQDPVLSLRLQCSRRHHPRQRAGSCHGAGDGNVRGADVVQQQALGPPGVRPRPRGRDGDADGLSGVLVGFLEGGGAEVVGAGAFELLAVAEEAGTHPVGHHGGGSGEPSNVVAALIAIFGEIGSDAGDADVFQHFVGAFEGTHCCSDRTARGARDDGNLLVNSRFDEATDLSKMIHGDGTAAR